MRHQFLSLLIIVFFGCADPEVERHLRFNPVPLKNQTDRVWTEGWLSVKENRGKDKVKMIELPFIFSHVADSLRTLNTPILIMSGGPGNSSLHMANGFSRSPAGFRADILVMDQRGTFYASPYLNCPEIDSARINGIQNGFYGQKLRDLHLAAVRACYLRWTELGVDLNGYNTLESVEDIEALRSLLDIDEFILYGMSYSCKLMTAYATTYPDRVKALILDSPLPHDSNYDEEAFTAIDSVFRIVLNYYTEEEKLYLQWTSYIESIQDTVFTLNLDSLIVHYTSAEIIDAAMNLLGDHGSLDQLPSMVKRLISGDHKDVRAVMESYFGSGRQAKGMRYSTWIAEELPDEEQDRIKKNREAIPWLTHYAVNDISFETAKNWTVRSIYDSRDWPDLLYEGPVMILSGTFDPWTPVAYGKKMKERFPQAKFNIYPERTHLPGFTIEGATDIYEFLVEL